MLLLQLSISQFPFPVPQFFFRTPLFVLHPAVTVLERVLRLESDVFRRGWASMPTCLTAKLASHLVWPLFPMYIISLTQNCYKNKLGYKQNEFIISKKYFTNSKYNSHLTGKIFTFSADFILLPFV